MAAQSVAEAIRKGQAQPTPLPPLPPLPPMSPPMPPMSPPLLPFLFAGGSCRTIASQTHGCPPTVAELGAPSQTSSPAAMSAAAAHGLAPVLSRRIVLVSR